MITFSTDSPGFLFYSSAANANNRNWGMFSNFITYGDLDIRQSTALNGSPHSAGASRLYINKDGNVGIGTTNPTAKVHIAAGTAVAGTAPLKLTRQTTAALLTVLEEGVFEYAGDTTDSHLYFTHYIAGVLTRTQIV